MSRPYNFSPVNWGGQEPGAHGTSHVLNEAGTAGRGRQNPHYPPVRSFTMTGPSFEDVKTSSQLFRALILAWLALCSSMGTAGRRVPWGPAWLLVEGGDERTGPGTKGGRQAHALGYLLAQAGEPGIDLGLGSRRYLAPDAPARSVPAQADLPAPAAPAVPVVPGSRQTVPP